MSRRLLFVWICAAAAASGAPDLSGVWAGTMHTSEGGGMSQPIRLALKQEGTSISGTAGPSASQSLPIQKGVFEVGAFSFEIATPDQRVLKFQMELAGDAGLRGTFSMGNAPGAASGTIELKRGTEAAEAPPPAGPLKAYDDVRHVPGMRTPKDFGSVDVSTLAAILPTLTFNQKTPWPEASRMPKSPRPADLIAAATDPGLGIRQLHREGITGKGVAVAIIDQPLLLDHPEIAGRVAAYEDVGCKSKSSMHGPAVASLLVGETMGTAPDAKLYYAAAPRWLRDAAYEAKAIDWMLAQNRKLPPAERIRVVSVSASPGMTGEKNPALWVEAVRRAEAEGLLVLDCSDERAVVGTCWFEKPDRNDPASCTPGFAGRPGTGANPKRVLAPSSPRTTAEEYVEGDFGLVYWGRGGMSWTVPYAAGVLALGWQVRPELTGKEALDLLFQTAYRPNEQTRIINPPEFVKAVRAYRK